MGELSAVFAGIPSSHLKPSVVRINMWLKPHRSIGLDLTVGVFGLFRGIPILDVERFNISSAVSLFWSRKSAIVFLAIAQARACDLYGSKRICPIFSPQFWQLYNSVTLFRLAGHEDCKEWQVGNGFNPPAFT